MEKKSKNYTFKQFKKLKKHEKLEYLKNVHVENLTKLEKLGYKHTIYYLGNSKFQEFWTKLIHDYLTKFGYEPIYNRAGFKHDLFYSLKLDVKTKKEVDKIFYKDMWHLFLTHNEDRLKLCQLIKSLLGLYKGGKDLTPLKLVFQMMRLFLFYIIVRIRSPFYFLMGKKA